MEDVTELIAKVSQEVGPEASDGQITEKVLEAINALPESEREHLLEQMVKGASSGQLRRLEQETGSAHEAESA